tara:strand:- start:9328 stop:9708 length:381 start_codon:yes stop_codon:yes gene_type:complete
MITEIISGIYIGDANYINDLNLLKIYDINLLINCSTKLPFIKNDINKVRIPLNCNDDIIKNKEKILSFLKDNFLKKNVLLISDCDYHIIICCLFIIKYGNISHINIKEIIKNINKDLSIDFDFSII